MKTNDICRYESRLTPYGKLLLVMTQTTGSMDPAVCMRLEAAFHRGSGHGLLQLATGELGQTLPPDLAYWRDFGSRFLSMLRSIPDAEERRDSIHVPVPTPSDLTAFTQKAPPFVGIEYLSSETLESLWYLLESALKTELLASKLGLQDFLIERNPAWNLVGRVHFNLAENRRDEMYPFAFLATYTTHLSSQAKAQHLPLGHALREYADSSDKSRLMSLLVPVRRAATKCQWLRGMIDTGEIFHPIRWTPDDAYRFLKDMSVMEESGVILRLPANWGASRPPRPAARMTIGSESPVGFGAAALLDFRMDLALDGESLSKSEMEQLLAGSDGLVLIRGRWIEVDRSRIEQILKRFDSMSGLAENGVTVHQGMRLLAGLAPDRLGSAPDSSSEWACVTAGTWLESMLQELRQPETLATLQPGQDLRGQLRPYQEIGVRWLHFLSSLGLGGCLADDMGLGKTVQTLALLLIMKKQPQANPAPNLLVAPASLLSNWQSEIDRFAPSLTVRVIHSSATAFGELKGMTPEQVSGLDLVITSYSSFLRYRWLPEVHWKLVILDEAHAIKNPDTKQTRALKKVKSDARFALTGTPVENRLMDLWSIFDFVNPGLLGSITDFMSLTKRLTEGDHQMFAPLRQLVRPYILRRLKTDRSIIADLPEKTELKAFCLLTKKQVALYETAVTELAHQLESVEGIARRGLVLSCLMRLKQICNHPSHWLRDDSWSELDSGKWIRLREITEVIAEKQEKVLIFTQFKELTEPLALFLESIFRSPGRVLHGSIPVGKRKELVRAFQEDESVPFFVLSLKAGGSGLNLTAASHVVHFDRWWNPAVENQATDRSFRIGQKKNVLVHKFICRGTIEDRIDQLIESKTELSDHILKGGGELMLTEMSDAELLRLVTLDVHTVLREV